MKSILFLSLLFHIIPLILAYDRCSFTSSPAWSQCRCVPIQAASDPNQSPHIHIMCQHISSATVPQLPNPENVKGVPPHIVAISMRSGSMAFIQQDAFKYQPIQSLDFSNNQIQTVNVNAFRGLEIKLTQLNLSHNNLTVIPTWALTYLHSLQILHLEHNRIDILRSNTFDETQLNNLQFLYLNNNQLQVIPNLSLRHLKLIVLMLANNRITEIQKMALPTSLSFIDLRNNLLTQIPYYALGELKNLQSLDFEGNNITHLHDTNEITFESEIKLVLRNNKIRRLDRHSFRSFRRIKDLDISYNQIKSIDDQSFETVSQMTSLDLSYNKIAYIPRGTLKNFAKSLRKLNLAENNIHTTPEAIKELKNVIHLNLNGNKLTRLNEEVLQQSKHSISELLIANNHLETIPNHILGGMQSLQSLDISKNRIKTIKKEPFHMHTIPNLLRMNLAGNRIVNVTDAQLFRSTPKLRFIDLSFNRIRQLSPDIFGNLAAIESIFLQNNQIKTFALFEPLANLRHLMLDNNKFEHLSNFSLIYLPKLQHLSIAGNNIRFISDETFSSTHNSQLKSLNLAHNKISSISSRCFANLPMLQQLRLSHNHIRTISTLAFSNLPNLRYLDLSHNKIIRLMPSSFVQLNSLDILHLSNNNLHQIDRDAFRNFNSIQTLKLSHNAFRNFTCNQLGSVSQVKNLYLDNNQITHIDISCISRGLNKLILSSNAIEKIDRQMLQDGVELGHLDLSNNGVIDVDKHAFLGCRKLAHLSLANNYIRHLWKGTFSSQHSLNTLDISNNELIILPNGIFGSNNIHDLFASNNKLTTVPREALDTTAASIHHLDLSGNQIKSLESTHLTRLNNLSVLCLSNNQIDSIEDGSFEHLLSLTNLDLSNNPVTSLSPTAFRDISHSILLINMANTGLFSIPKFSHRSIQSLNLSSNHIYELSEKDLAPFNKLINLDLSHNNLKSIAPIVFSHLHHLKSLNISNNPLKELTNEHLQQLYRLNTLHLANMPNLARLPDSFAYSSLNNLQTFVLTNIPDTAVPYKISDILSNLPPLQYIDVEVKDSELLRQFHQTDTRMLRHLSISGRKLQKLDIGAFSTIRGFRVRIDIHNTSISYFPSKIFDTLTGISLLSLSLTNNQLSHIDPFTSTLPPVVNQHGTVLQSIKLKGNPIECSCKMKWITDYIHVTKLLTDQQPHDFELIECRDDDNSLVSAANELFAYRDKINLFSQRHHLADDCRLNSSRIQPLLMIISILFTFFIV